MRERPSSPKVSLEATGSCHRHPSRHLNWYEFPDRRARLSRGWRKPSSFVLIYLDAQLECFARHCACFGKRFAVRYQLWKRGATHAIAALAIGKERAQVLRIRLLLFPFVSCGDYIISTRKNHRRFYTTPTISVSSRACSVGRAWRRMPIKIPSARYSVTRCDPP